MIKPYQAKIVMIGPTGVGKTSLLAAMYPNLETHFPSGDYQLVPEENTRQILDQLRKELKGLGENGGIRITDGHLRGTRQVQEFNFDLQYKGVGEAKPVTDLSLQIWDIPGALCTDKEGEEAVKYLNGSDISFWCVDSVALMERGGEYNDAINEPEKMCECICRSQLKDGHTVCIALMRAETYEQDDNSGKLFDTFRKKYAELALRLRKNPRIGGVYFCAVQTTGNLRFNNHEGKNPVFIRARDISGYIPKYCELPVLIAVRQSLGNAIRDAVEEMNRIVRDYLPFTRWVFFFPGHKEYKRKKGVAQRLSSRLKHVRDDIRKELVEDTKNKRLFDF